MPNLERFIEDMEKRLPELDFEGKRLALDMLGITIWLDGQNVEITGTIDPGIVLTRSSAGYSPLGGGAPLERPAFIRALLSFLSIGEGVGKTMG